MQDTFALKGNICYTPEPGHLEIKNDAYVICDDGICQGVFDELPDVFEGCDVIKMHGGLIIPGMIDLHTHAPQYPLTGTGMDYELMEWLDRNIFPEESRYSDIKYADKVYKVFTRALKEGATSRAVIFGTIHTQSTLLLMDSLEDTKLETFVGRVNMDQNAPPELSEKDAGTAAEDTRRFLDACRERKYRRTHPIITPRFAPSCTGELLEALGKIRREYDLPVQSHLSENLGEMDLVSQLFPESSFYGDVYDHYDLFGKTGKTVMAHCVHSTDAEIERIRENGVWVAHCPGSNINLASGIAPIRHYMEKGLRVGIGTDVAAGHSLSMFRAVTDAVQASKMYWRYVDQTASPLTFADSFYLATKGGGSFFGKVGSFEAGYEFDAIVIDDGYDLDKQVPRLSTEDRLERAFYLELDSRILMKFTKGRLVFKRRKEG